MGASSELGRPTLVATETQRLLVTDNSLMLESSVFYYNIPL